MPIHHVHLGPVEFEFESDSGFVRYVRIGSDELIRGIYAVVRDQNWSTPPNRVTDLKVSKGPNAWQANWQTDAELGAIHYHWSGSVTAKQTESQVIIEFEFEGESRSDFQSNRTGICVLHPRSVQSVKCEIEHNHGECEASTFPKSIKPDQPFKDVKAITLEVEPGIHYRTEFYGEVFETEDQRNYADASYKTYSRPQEWKKPFDIKKGDRISQRVKVIIDIPSQPARTQLKHSHGQLPGLGSVVTRDLSDSEAKSLKELGASGWLADATGLSQAKALGGAVFYQSATASVPVDLSPDDAICLTPPEQWQKLNQVRGAKRLPTANWAFMQLNGSRPSYAELEGSCWPMQPCIHLTDTLTALEGGWTLEDQVNTARAFGSKFNAIGPIEISGDKGDPRLHSIESTLLALTAIASAAKANADQMFFADAARLPKSGFALALELLKDSPKEIEIWDWEPFFMMIRAKHTLLINLSWEPSELYKLCPIDRPENMENGLRNAYRLIAPDNFADWKTVLAGPESHNPLTAIPPRSIVVL